METEAWLTGETSQRSGELGPHADGFLAHSSPGRSILEIMESAESGRVSDKLEFSRYTPDYLRELPGTSYVAAWVHFPEHLNPVKLYWLEEQQEYSGIRFLWAGVRTGEESMLGFPMLDARGSGFSPCLLYTSRCVSETGPCLPPPAAGGRFAVPAGRRKAALCGGSHFYPGSGP